MKYVAIIPLENPISMRKETDGWRKFHVSVGRRNSFFQEFFGNYHEFISTIRDSLSNFITLFGQLKGISENIRDPFSAIFHTKVYEKGFIAEINHNSREIKWF